PDKLPASYSRYLVNGLRQDFDMPGTPIRLTFRGQGDKNPYKGRREKNAGALKKHLGRK
ncbi:MAG: ribosome biogenesis GTPase Der, partial [Paracoccaceae bacterium]